METRISARKTYLDVLRILASFLVCYNHAHGFSLFLYQEADGSLLSWVNVFLSVITTNNIPLFFMVSGALLLGKQESYQALWKKRILRILVVLFAASGVTYLINSPRPLSVTDFCRRLLSGEITISYWYLYAYLGYLLFLPFLRKIAVRMTHQDLLALTVLRTLFVPGLMIVNFCLGCLGIEKLVLSGQLHIPLIGYDSFFCPLAGYFLCHRMDFQSRKKEKLLWCTAAFFGASLLSSVMTYAEGATAAFSETYIGMFRYFSAMALFALVKYACETIRISPKLEALIRHISSVTFGIYLLEPIVTRFLFTPFFSRIPWTPVIITVSSAVWCVVCMAAGGSLVFLLRKIPGVRNYL